MKVAISYFYQVRNFKKNMLPISTAIGDPKWFHDFQSQNYIFKDKRGILNGIRCNTIINQGMKCGNLCGNCDHTMLGCCQFIHCYQKYLDEINFPQFKKDMEELANKYAEHEGIKDEITLVFLVHEAPNNPCSERWSLIKFFRKNGMECGELTYPII